ncbi:MAG TPA: RNA polymerase sigma-70 factor [Burkholderiales bacterium]|nr:RNA polymerase sigma-70 factor [Burkholderiales bacterium]
MQDHAALYEKHRPRLFGVAYRMLGSRADAEDVLQDAFLRWHEADLGGIRSYEAWLVTITTRLCLDRLRAAKQDRERYVGPWLPEPIIVEHMPSPELRLELANEVSVAFLALLERLGPEKRAAFLLHEVFDYDYADIAQMLGKSEPALRQMVRRAREEVREGRPKFSVDETVHERLLEKFLAAASSGDRDAVMALLRDDVEYVSDGGGKVYAALKVLRGAERIGRLYYSIARSFPGLSWRVIRVNGELGVATLMGGALHSVIAFQFDGERIAAIYSMRNPDKLAGISMRSLGA